MKKKEKQLEPQQADFLEYYLDPNSPSYSNAYQSALRAGFKESYAKQIKAKSNQWLDEGLNRQNKIVEKAEKRLLEFVGDSKDKRVCIDATKFALKTLGKDRGYTEKVEINNKNTSIIIGKDELDSIVNKYT